jgi:hypothetical protein
MENGKMGHKDKECKGCKAYNTHHCNMSFKYKSIECPCLYCLIKGICVDDCKEIDKYAQMGITYE